MTDKNAYTGIQAHNSRSMKKAWRKKKRWQAKKDAYILYSYNTIVEDVWTKFFKCKILKR